MRAPCSPCPDAHIPPLKVKSMHEFPLSRFPLPSRTMQTTAEVPRSVVDLATLNVPLDSRRNLARAWLLLALLALLASGFFSILLVLSRTPQLQALFSVADFFRVALVVHVDLSVLVWFLAVGGAMWTLNGAPRQPALAWLAFSLAATGTIVLCIAPFAEKAVPIMANYIPVLDGRLFTGGLLLFGTGVLLLCLHSMRVALPVGTAIDFDAALRFGLNAALVSCVVSAIAFAASWRGLPAGLDPRVHYELLFWGGGHVLQFCYTL
ncbi:MAG TPA: hypothetical protein VFV17_00420, partial [Usitatibacteraceae bacterium]|nr:hypothetical protein [Usitatibacteraceae bacterium]